MLLPSYVYIANRTAFSFAIGVRQSVSQSHIHPGSTHNYRSNHLAGTVHDAGEKVAEQALAHTVRPAYTEATKDLFTAFCYH
jgi:hypothetical protein